MSYSENLQTGSTTLCRCFRVTRADGRVYGFTDHDSDLSFGGVTYAADAAMSASDAAANLGLAPDELETSGALSADFITEADLVNGRWDGASVEIWDVDWRDPKSRALLGRYSVGSIERRGAAFRAEMRSAAAGLDRKVGRVFGNTCDCRRLGDPRCGLDLSALGLSRSGRVQAAANSEITLSGLPGVTPSDFDRGILRLASGHEYDIRVARADRGGLRLSLWQVPGVSPAPGESATIEAGCDRSAETCRERFGNIANFRGFPHMPGEAVVSQYARVGDPDLDGGSRFG